MLLERSSFTIKALAKRWNKGEEKIEEYLQKEKLFCSVRLKGEFRRYQWSEDGNEVRFENKIIGPHLLFIFYWATSLIVQDLFKTYLAPQR
jgi:hypothetical protein